MLGWLVEESSSWKEFPTWEGEEAGGAPCCLDWEAAVGDRCLGEAASLLAPGAAVREFWEEDMRLLLEVGDFTAAGGRLWAWEEEGPAPLSVGWERLGVAMNGSCNSTQDRGGGRYDYSVVFLTQSDLL